MQRNLTTAEIERIIAEARRERSRMLGDYLSRGYHAALRWLGALIEVAGRAAAMRGSQSPAAVRLRLREFERNSA